MSKPTNHNFRGANTVTSMPKELTGTGRDIAPLLTIQNQNIMCWKFTKEQLQEIKDNGGKLWISVFGPAVPTHYLSTKAPFDTMEDTPMIDLDKEEEEITKEKEEKLAEVLKMREIFDTHTLYQDGDKDIPEDVKDKEGNVTVPACKVCGLMSDDLIKHTCKESEVN